MITVRVFFQPAYPVPQDKGYICMHGSSRSYISSEAVLVKETHKTLCATIHNMSIVPDKDTSIHLSYWSTSHNTSSGGHEVPLAVIATAKADLFELFKHSQVIVPLMDTTDVSQAKGGGGISIVLVSSSFGFNDLVASSSIKKSSSVITKKYEETMKKAVLKMRPDHQYIDVQINGSDRTIPMFTAVQMATRVRLVEDYDQEPLWATLLDVSLARFAPGTKKWNDIQSDDTRSRVLNSMLVLQFTGHVYVSDFVRRENGKRDPTDTWNMLRTRPRFVVDSPAVSFDCEDAAWTILESITSICRRSTRFKSRNLQGVQSYLREFTPWFIIGDIRIAGGERVAHAYVVLSHQERATIICEGTLLHDGVWSFKNSKDDNESTHFHYQRNLFEQPSMKESGVHWPNHIKVSAPIQLVKEQVLYSQVYMLFKVDLADDTLTQYLCKEEKGSAMIFFDAPRNHRYTSDFAAPLSRVDEPCSMPVSWICPGSFSTDHIGRHPKRYKAEYWVRVSTYNKFKDVIREGITEMFGTRDIDISVTTIACTGEFNVIRLLVF